MRGISFSRAWSIAKKEFSHLKRDPYTLSLALGLPIAFLIFFGFTINFDIRDVHIGIVDGDNTPVSRKLVEVFHGSDYFHPEKLALTAHPLKRLDEEKDKAILMINPHFGRRIEGGKPTQAQIILDGADNLTSGIVAGYLSGVQLAANKRINARWGNWKWPIRLKPRYLFNPELNNYWFFVPGLIAVINGLVATLLTAMTVAREWESGSMELLLATPLRPSEIIFGKIAPYAILGMIEVWVVFILARIVFHVPMRGSYWVLFISSAIFLAGMLAQGLLISVLTRQQQLAVQTGMNVGLLPALLMSGFIFPVQNMTPFFRHLTGIFAVRWFMQILRPVFLKGAGFKDLKIEFFALITLTLIAVMISIKSFKKDVEP